MRFLGVAAVSVLLAGGFAGWTAPARAQMQTPNINLLQDSPSKTPEEREAEAERDKAYKESLRKIPDAKASSDPWGTVRSGDSPKAAAPKSSPTSKMSASAKSKTKTGSNAN